MDGVDWFAIAVAAVVIVLVAAIRMRPRNVELRLHPDEPLTPEDWAAIRTLDRSPDYQLAVDHMRRSFLRSNDPLLAPRRLLETMEEHETDIAGAVMILTAASKVLTPAEREARMEEERAKDEEARYEAAAAAKLEARRRARTERKAELKAGRDR